MRRKDLRIPRYSIGDAVVYSTNGKVAAGMIARCYINIEPCPPFGVTTDITYTVGNVFCNESEIVKKISLNIRGAVFTEKIEGNGNGTRIETDLQENEGSPIAQ